MIKIMIIISISIITLILTDNSNLPECSLEDANKTDCAKDIAKDTDTLEQSCYNRSCCYHKIENNQNIPWCYNKTLNYDYKCQKYNLESLSLHLCLSCRSGYKKVNYTTYYPQYCDFVEENTQMQKYYYNTITHE